MESEGGGEEGAHEKHCSEQEDGFVRGNENFLVSYLYADREKVKGKESVPLMMTEKRKIHASPLWEV